MGKTLSKPPPPPIPGESCKHYVARVCGTDYYLINPWVDNVAGWTESMGSSSPFPRDGANDSYHMDMIKGLCLGDKEVWDFFPSDPIWDKQYMEQGGINWLSYAPYWKDPRANKKQKHKTKIDPEKVKSIEKDKFSKRPPPYSGLYPNLTETETLMSLLSTLPHPVPNAPPPPQPVLPPPPQQPQQPPPMPNQSTPPPPPSPTHQYPPLGPEALLSPPHTRSGEAYGADGGVDSTTSGGTHFPFMTMGNYLVKKIIDIEDINKIVKHCPKPTIAPEGTIAYLKKACENRNFTQEDMRLIITQVIGTHNTEWNWNNVPSVSIIQVIPNPGPPVGPDRVPHANEYVLNTEAGRTTMWTELTAEFRNVYKQRASLSCAMTCKQKKGETVSDFWKRFKDCWSQEAGLPLDQNPQLLINIFLGNVLPHLTIPIKQMISTWPSDTLPEFQKQLTQKEAAGCFDIKTSTPTPITTTHNYMGQTSSRPVQNRGRGQFRGRGRVMNRENMQRPRYPPGICYNCGDPNHWARDCTRSREDRTKREPVTQKQDPQFPIDWKNTITQ